VATITIQIVADLRQCTDDICATIRYLGIGYLVGMLKSVVGVYLSIKIVYRFKK
jgi:hypothetical protein